VRATVSDDGFVAIEVGDRLRLVPLGAKAVPDGRIAVTIARGAFGSGEHETTAACLEALEGLPELRGARVLDLGCGTGVLAVAAVALGARAAVAVDIEPAAVLVARENCRHNRVPERVGLLAGTLAALRSGAGFDVVAANVPAAVLVAEADELLGRVAAGAPLVLSGILWEELFDVEQRYRLLGCTTVRRRMLEEYVLLVLRAPVPPHTR
jgi:ribosomal protein L11 methyltransferase